MGDYGSTIECIRGVLGAPAAPEEVSGQLTVTAEPARIVDLCRSLKRLDSSPYAMLLDLCGVDYLGRDPRFEVVYHLLSLDSGNRLRIKVPVPETNPSVPSVTSVWRVANWFEREAYDMYGILFEGHPNLERLLTHPEFQGHPLRKDYRPTERHRLTRTYDLYDESELKVMDLEPGTDLSGLEFSEKMIVNIGPSHPATHGTFRIQTVMDGERIVDSRIEIGYLHRCFEKMAETHDYTGVIPYTDRLNYCSAFTNNLGYCLTVEKLMGIEVPPRARVIRIILNELNRIMDHLVCLAANLVDIGGLTNYFYLYRSREDIYTLLERCCGGRLTVSYGRIGGLSRDVPDDFIELTRKVLDELPRFLDYVDRMNTRNAIFQERTRGVGGISVEDALDWGYTGACLRAAGVPYDVRKADPYAGYEEYEFDIPVGSTGDIFDRYLVRMEEMRQSMRIIRQAIDKPLPEGPIVAEDRRVKLPDKTGVYTNIEDLMNHFKLIIDGIRPPAGEIYFPTEAANGELGFYLISDGSGRPYRLKVRPPCYPLYQSFSQLIKGRTIPDAVATLASLNVIAGELDR